MTGDVFIDAARSATLCVTLCAMGDQNHLAVVKAARERACAVHRIRFIEVAGLFPSGLDPHMRFDPFRGFRIDAVTVDDFSTFEDQIVAGDSEHKGKMLFDNDHGRTVVLTKAF